MQVRQFDACMRKIHISSMKNATVNYSHYSCDEGDVVWNVRSLETCESLLECAEAAWNVRKSLGMFGVRGVTTPLSFGLSAGLRVSDVRFLMIGNYILGTKHYADIDMLAISSKGEPVTHCRTRSEVCFRGFPVFRW